MKILIKVLSGLLFVSFIALTLHAGDPTTGRAIMERVDANDSSRDVKYVATMTLIDKSNSKRVRKFNYWRKKKGKFSKSMIKFMKPVLDKNIGLMTYSKGKGKSDQWLHLPAINDTKRILSSDKGNAFVGSDFYYEDFEKKNINDYSYRLIGKKDYKGAMCHIIEARAKSGIDSAYSKVKSWVRTDNFVIVKSIYYVDGRLRKVLYQRDIKKIQGFWTASTLVMKTVRKKHTTIMNLQKIKYNSGLKDSFFSKRFLERRL